MRVAILGPLEVHDADGVAVPLAGARLRALVARLALAGGQPVSTGALAEAVWEDAPPADVPNALQTLVSRARRALGGAAAVEQSAAGYRLAVSQDDVDALCFERLIAQGSLEQALGLWRGPALADAGSFAEPFARRLEGQRLDATVTLRTREFEQGTVRAGELEALVAENPLHEKLTGLLMRALAAEGRQADALAAYETLRAKLGDDLGIDPGPDLQAVHLAVLRGEVRRPALGRDALVRGGPGRGGPGRGGPGRGGPGRGGPSAPGGEPSAVPHVTTNLRAQLTSFVGRADEVKRVRLTLESYRLVTLVGPGGAGKTRLAAEVAAEIRDATANDTAEASMAPDAPDGIWIVELASVTDPADVPKAVLAATGLRETRLLPDGTQRVTSLNARDRLLEGLAGSRALLVLDNCEHLIDACAYLADALLAHCPRLRIVATSREPLGITGESLLVVPPLAEAPAVRLFADRAKAVSPSFTLDEATRPLVTDIVTRLDGLPLAIELAAARLRTLPLAEIATRLTDRFRLLTGGSRTALPRHRTLRAVVEWSWDLLTAEERLLAERFSVFPAGATPAAVAAVCADSAAPETAETEIAARDTDELLSSLVDKSLLQPLEDGTRLRMLETIREYGAEQLAGRDEVGELRRRHAGHYCALMREAEPRLFTRDQLYWIAELRADRDNILAALRYCCDAGEADDALTLALSLALMALLLGNDSDVTEWIRDALAVPGGANAGLRTIAEAVYTLTSVMDPEGETRAAGTDPDLAARLDELDLDRYPLAGLLRQVFAVFSNDNERARKYFDQAREGKDEWLVATSWMMAAGLAENDGRLTEMVPAAAEAVRRFRVLGERWGLSTALRTMGNAMLLQGDLAGAETVYAEASSLLEELGHHEDLAQIQLRRAELAARRGDHDRARQFSAAARSLAESSGSPIDEGIAAGWWAAAEVAWGNLDAARPLQEAAERQLARFSAAHPARGHMEAMVAANGTLIAIADSDLPAAREQAARSYRAAAAAQDMPLLALAAGAVAELALAAGRSAAAAELLGARTVVRGGEDPTDPTTVKLAPLLRAALGDAAYEAAYQKGKAMSRAEATQRLDPANLDES